MSQTATVRWIRGDDQATLALVGDWTLANALDLAPAVSDAAVAKPPGQCVVDAHQLTALDTTGALLLLRALSSELPDFASNKVQGMSPADLALLRLVASRHGQPVPPRT